MPLSLPRILLYLQDRDDHLGLKFPLPRKLNDPKFKPKKMQLYCIFSLNVSHRRSKHQGIYIPKDIVMLKYEELLLKIEQKLILLFMK